MAYLFTGSSKDAPDTRVESSSRDVERGSHNSGIAHHVELHQANSRTSVFTTSTKVDIKDFQHICFSLWFR